MENKTVWVLKTTNTKNEIIQFASLKKNIIVNCLKDEGYWYSKSVGCWINNSDHESRNNIDYQIEKVELI